MIRRGFLLLTGSFGALALVAQVVLLRLLMVSFYGSEMVVALVLAGWLAGVFLGARATGPLIAGRDSLRVWLMVVPLVWLAVLALTVGFTCSIQALLDLSPGEVAPLDRIMVWTALLTMPVSFFVGGLFVLAGEYYDRQFGTTAEEHFGVGAVVFWAESAGACAGLLVFTYVLVGRAGPVRILGLFALLMVVLQTAVLPRLISNRLILTAAVCFAALIAHVFGLGAGLDRLVDRYRFGLAHPAYTLLEARDTPYQHLTLGERGGEMALFGNHSFLASWPDPYLYQRLCLFFLTEAPEAKRVLLAGQGPGGFLHEFLARDIEALTYVALDPGETELVAAHLPEDLRSDLIDPRLTVVHDDIRAFLAGTETGPFDLIVINAPDPDTAQINRLYTREFFQAARSRLSPRGVLVTSISGADNYWSGELLSYGHSLYRTLTAVFAEVKVTPGDHHYFVAGVREGLVTDDPAVLADRYRDRGYDSPYLTPRSLYAFFPPSGTEYLKSRLARADGGRINTDASPLSYFLRLVWWEKMTGRAWTRGLLARASDMGAWGPWAAAILAAPFVWMLLRPGAARLSAWTMAMTGGVSMALQIILIFLYQNRYGVIYRQIGLITALFMAGLAAGGLLGRMIVKRNRCHGAVIPMLEIGLALTAAGTCWAAMGGTARSIPFLVAGTGLLAGTEFSLLFSLYLDDKRGPTVTRALTGLESSDHLGAVFGALVTGLVLAPILGLGRTALALAGIKLLNGLTLSVSLRRM